MADNGTRTNFICSYFEKGLAGNNSETIKSNTTCRFFKIGTCKYGSACYFRHDSEPANNACIQNNLQDSSSINQRTVPTATSMELKNTTRSIHVPEEWVKAPEFIPSTISSVAGSSTSNNEMFNASGTSTGGSEPLLYAQVESPSGQAFDHTLQSLCPYAENTETYETNCPYLHGNICELYGHAALHPCNEVFQKRHTNACIKQHEVDMELSFDIQRSKEMSCGICFEIIMEKSSSDQRFGILPNCNHCYCLTCIKKWRRTKDFERKIRKACPECRVISDFIYPSMYWVDAKEEKEKLIKDYKNALSTQDCKYFRKGLGICPRGNKCLMLHALPDGSKIDFSSPRNSNNEVLHFYSNLFNNGFSFV